MRDHLAAAAAWVVPSVWDEPAATVALRTASSGSTLAREVIWDAYLQSIDRFLENAVAVLRGSVASA